MVFTTQPHAAYLDLDDWVGQRVSTFRFALVNGVTGAILPDLHPIMDTPPTLIHDTTRKVKRQVQGLQLGVADSARINPITDRLLIYMVLNGIEYPMGRYMWADDTDRVYSSGSLGTEVLLDEMNLVDQQLENTYSAQVNADTFGNVSSATSCEEAIEDLTRDLPITVLVEPSPFYTVGSWAIGSYRGDALEDLSVEGDWFSPWFDNQGRLRYIRVFDPALAIPTFDLDSGNRVIQGTIGRTNDLLIAPNRFIVASNGPASAAAAAVAIVGRYDVPSSAPHSIANRGFVVPQVEERQIDTQVQATAAARNIGIRQTVYERITLSTPPDPRHDSYDVIRFLGVNWLELAWSLPLHESSQMTHTMRRTYQ